MGPCWTNTDDHTRAGAGDGSCPFFVFAGTGAGRKAERGLGRARSRPAFGGAPAGAAFLFWAPHALPNDSGSDRRGAAGTDRPRSRAPHALLCRRLCGGCGPCAYYSFSCRSGSFTAPNWLLAPPRALLENAFENGTTRVTGFRRAMGNRIGTPYAVALLCFGKKCNKISARNAQSARQRGRCCMPLGPRKRLYFQGFWGQFGQGRMPYGPQASKVSS